MGEMKEKQLTQYDFPMGYAVCFNSECTLKEQCLHHQAYLLRRDDRTSGPAIYPEAWKDGQCKRYSEDLLVKKAWGFSQIYDNVPHYKRAEAHRCVMNYFSAGCGPYYRYHHGENKLTPRQQQDIMDILAHFGSTDGLDFDHYEMDFNFD